MRSESDLHIALAAAAQPQYAAPVSGQLQLGDFGQAMLKYEIRLERAAH
ncbi:MAG: hypothetical protein F6K00_26440 [Leptolyngbya sp. SIOISBB]|nr:hypothetical protein [Leptolyngbya sp. SIOISBB]